MSLFSGPDEHAANPPETWVAFKFAPRHWYLGVRGGSVITTHKPTKREVEALRTEGFYADLYAKEARWYAGELVPGWKPYAEVVR